MYVRSTPTKERHVRHENGASWSALDEHWSTLLCLMRVIRASRSRWPPAPGSRTHSPAEGVAKRAVEKGGRDEASFGNPLLVDPHIRP